MPRNGSGIYSVPASTAGVTLTPISSTAYDNFLTDISSEMTNSLPTTGVKAMGANLPMGGNKITNMADPTVSTDAATKNYVDNITHGKVVNVQILTAASGTYTRSANATTGDIYAIGGGAAGGGAAATGAGQAAIGGGGGAGSLAVSYNVALPATQAYTVGTGGVGVSAGTGGIGNTTTFGAISAGGGAGGTSSGVLTVSTPSLAFPGTGSVAVSGGTFNFPGASGLPGLLLNSAGLSGAGGPSPLLGGGANGTGGAANAGASWGAGGSGALNGASAAAKAGGNGFQGVIIIVERT